MNNCFQKKCRSKYFHNNFNTGFTLIEKVYVCNEKWGTNTRGEIF